MSVSPEIAAAIGWSPGKVISGRYRIKRLIGAGGMGVVAVADDLLLRKPVAMKALLPEVSANPDYVERFQKEVALAHSVTHPNIARTYDLGEDDGVHFFTMEYLRGQPLDKRLESGERLPANQVRELGIRMLMALQSAHEAGVIHRDLKPANLMLVDDDRQVVVLDFGISGVVHNGDAPDDQEEEPTTESALASQVLAPGYVSKAMKQADWAVTSAGMGSPPYMSPEQWTKKPSGPTSDLYSIGAILFQCLTGRPVFSGDSLFYYMSAHLQEEPVRCRSLVPEVPAYLDNAIAKSLSKVPNDRFQSAREMAGAITPRIGLPHWVGAAMRAAVLGVVFALLGWAVVVFQESVIIHEMRPAVQRLAELVALDLEPEELDSIGGYEDAQSPLFIAIQHKLQQVMAANPDVKYLYVFRRLGAPGMWEFVVDADPILEDQNGDGIVDASDREDDAEAGGYPGELYDGSQYEALTATLDELIPQADADFAYDGWGITLSGYAPVGDNSGPGGYVVGVDSDNAGLVSFRKFVLVVCLSSWLVLVGLFRFVEIRRVRREAVQVL